MNIAVVISEEAALRELWVSFSSLVRSYLAAAHFGLESPQIRFAEPSKREFHLVGPQRVLQLEMRSAQGDGSWAIYKAPLIAEAAPLDAGDFRIGLDGLVEWTGQPGWQPMDSAAEALTTLVTG